MAAVFDELKTLFSEIKYTREERKLWGEKIVCRLESHDWHFDNFMTKMPESRSANILCIDFVTIFAPFAPNHKEKSRKMKENSFEQLR